MKLFGRITLLTVATALFAVITALAISSGLASNALKKEVSAKLEAILASRHASLTRYFSELENDLIILANSESTATALIAFTEAFQHEGSKAQAALQQQYIHGNPHPEGQKDQLITTHLNTDYDRIHTRYHPFFHRVQKSKALYDLFLFDMSGNLVYSVFKELDFATNMVTGPWKDSGLAHVTRPLLENAIANSVVFEDFEPYAPSHGAPASFISSPVFADGVQLGVLVFQMPISKINLVMQERTGLGQTGEAYLVNEEGWMLSDSRFSESSTILTTKVESETSRLALTGESGFMVAQDYRGQSVFSAFKPFIPFPDAIKDGEHSAQWAILSEIDENEAMESADKLIVTLSLLGIVMAIVAGMAGVWGGRSIAGPLALIKNALARLTKGESTEIPCLERVDEIGEMAKAADSFRALAEQTKHEHWVAETLAGLANQITSGEMSTVPGTMISYFCKKLKIPVGAVYVPDEDGVMFVRAASYGMAERSEVASSFRIGDGLIGQCAQEKTPVLLSPVPEGLAVISTGMAKVPATSIALFPFVHLDEVMAIVEVATTTEISSSQYELLERCSQRLGLHLANLRASDHNKTLLTRSQAQAKALAEQQEKLQENNETLQQQSEELMAQTDELRAQTEELRASEEELKASEEELKAQQEELQLRNAELEQQRTELELAKKDLTEKADQLSQASTYKSEFLANMSHELRTPLNSILILSNSLAENDQQNLLPDQIESASVIHESGTSLLTLINDILDLSKIEAGKLSMHIESFPVRDLFSYLQKVFLPQADKKSIQFELVVSNNVPDAFCNDRQRMNQVLTNLLSNAIKFTNSGGVKFEVTYEGNRLSVAVTDTGIGIAEDKIDHIFGAFNQEDGSTSRKFGGTGLGLAITKKLIELMGGEIIVESNPGVGSTFTVNLPNQTSKAQPQINQYEDQPKTSAPTEVVSSALAPTSSVTSERKKGLHVLLVEDDQRLVKIFCRLIEGLGYQVTAVGTGEEALSYIAHESPEVMLLDLGLPDISGMEVLRNLRQQDSLNSIPVFIISGAADTGEAASLGAQGYLKKPITKDMLSSVLAQVESGPASITESKDNKRLLVVEDDPNAQKALQLLLAKEPITIIPETQGATAMGKLVSANPDAILLDIGLGDTDGITWLKEAKSKVAQLPPVIVYSGRELNEESLFELREFTDAIIVKGEFSSDRLKDEILHAFSSTPTVKATVDSQDQPLSGKRMLLVDDDMRNLYAISTVLRKKGAKVSMAQSGSKALELLDQEPMDILLTDIMMPEMDGYELMKKVRDKGMDRLPIVALTAKAMQGDKDICLSRGANDYVSKPIDMDQLISVIGRLVKG